ncbi:MAG: metallophosphoesterase [Erysipelotrichaceae bacterium]
MKSLKFKIFSILIITMAILALDILVIEPNSLNIRYQSISSNTITEEFNNYTIMFFSDLNFGDYTDEARVQKIVNRINEIKPNTIVFLGDLYNYTKSNTNITLEIQERLTNILKEIDVKYGKFAVLGNYDVSDNIDVANPALTTLTNAGFEVLNNNKVNLYHNNNNYITLTGLSSFFSKDYQILNLDPVIDENHFNIVVAHEPDIFTSLISNNINLFVGAHSLGGQINLPFYGPLFLPEGAKKYYNGQYYVANTIIDVTSGVGLANYKARFLANSELLVYRLIKE